MARTSKTNTITEQATTNEKVVAENSVVGKNENTKETTKRVSRASVELNDSEEIEVMSIIPNVSYHDKKTGDDYEWDEAGHTESMTVETIKDMWRNNKGYFRNMWLRPLDERVVVKLGLTKLFEDYEFLLNASNYTTNKLDKVFSVFDGLNNQMKNTIITKVKQMVEDEEIKDVKVIKRLGVKLDVDFISLL